MKIIRSFAICILLIAHNPQTLLALDPDRAVTQYVRDIWNVDHGLPSTAIPAILQTQDGYLWLATTNGLTRFDGVEFKTFDAANTKEIQAPEIFSLAETHDGTLWIGSYWGGLISHSKGKFIRFGKKEGLSDERVVCVYHDQSGDLWMGTPSGLFRMQNGKFKKFWKDEGLPGNVVWDITQDHTGVLWIATVGGGLYRFDKNHFIKFPDVDEKDVLTLLADRETGLWVGTDAGLFRIQNGKTKKYTVKDGLSGDVIEAMMFDKDRNLWIGTNAGLTRFRNERSQNLTSKNGGVDDIRSLYEDREGNLWAGAAGSGLIRLLDGKLISFTKEEGVENDYVTSVHGSKNGGVWLATNAGITKITNGKVENFSLDAESSQWHTWCVWEDSGGTVWVGTGGAGLLKLEDGKIKKFPDSQNLLSKTIWGLFEDRNGFLWATNYGFGLNQLENGMLKETFTVERGLSTSYTLKVYEDNDGALLVLTEDGGINRYQNGKFSVYISLDQLGHQPLTLYRDKDGVLWIGSLGGGLKRFQNGKVISIQRVNGILDDTVGDILEDSAGIFWISSTKGIFTVSKKELNDYANGKISSVQSVAYGKSEGMKSVECNVGSPGAWKDPDGKFWFPTVKGVVMVDPQKLKKNSHVPPVLIDEIFVDGKIVGSTDSKTIELDPGKEKFEFHYQALSLVNSKKVFFQYKLEGYDKNWVDAGTRRTAYYTHLSPGRYKFRVKACNNDGLWNETGASASFYLRPHFYQTSWFLGLCGMVVLLVGIGMHQARIKRISKEFKAVIAERMRIAREIHDGLAQSLAGIVMQLETAQLTSIQHQSKQHLDRALELARLGVQDARKAIGELRPAPLEAQDFPYALRSMIQHQIQNTGLEFYFQLSGNPLMIPADSQAEILRICQESVQNTMKHAQAKALNVNMEYKNESMQLTIQDDGRGFDGTVPSRPGHFGLTGIQERSNQINAQFSIKSSEGKGTSIQIVVPLESPNPSVQ